MVGRPNLTAARPPVGIPRLRAPPRHGPWRRRVALALLRRALPQACALCRQDSGQHVLCASCEAGLPILASPCPCCALPPRSGAARCRDCLRQPPPWSRAVAAWPYAFPVDRLVQQLKYGGRLHLAEPLAQGVAAAVLASGAALPDALVALPLTPTRQAERGFNQAALIARGIGGAIGKPVLDGLVRIRDAGPQAALPLAQRAANVAHAFAARDVVRGRRVAIVDDVLTTGATLGAAVRAARDGGALDVQVFVVARTLPP